MGNRKTRNKKILGYGKITSDYQHDSGDPLIKGKYDSSFPHKRDVEWYCGSGDNLEGVDLPNEKKLLQKTIHEIQYEDFELYKNLLDEKLTNNKSNSLRKNSNSSSGYSSTDVINNIKEKTIINGLEVYIEGDKKLVNHLVSERNTKIVEAKKRHAIENGTLRCVVPGCGFDFSSTYGKDFIECQHKLPLSTRSSESETSLEDLALVCSNCHSIIHSRKEPFTIEEVAGFIYKNMKR